MKIRIKLTDAEAIDSAIENAVDESLAGIYENLSDDEVTMLEQSRRQEFTHDLSEWIECGVAVTLEIDTIMETAKVVPNV